MREGRDGNDNERRIVRINVEVETRRRRRF